MLEIKKFCIKVGTNTFQGKNHTLNPGTIVELFAKSDEAIEDLVLLLSGLITRVKRTTPAPKGELLRVEQDYSSENLDFIKLNNTSIYDLSNISRAQKIGTIFGNPELYIIGNTVAEEYAYSFAAVDKPSPDLQSLKRYDLFGKSRYRTEYLSAGERHRLNWACTLELNPSLIIADLSQSNLDVGFIKNLIKWLEEESKNRVTIVHGLPPGIFEVDTEVWLLKDGTLDFSLINGSSIVNNTFPSFMDQQNNLESIFELRNIEDAIIKVEMLSRKEITHGISFQLNKNEVLQIHGSNGVGKTTLGKMLTGQIHKDEILGSTTPEIGKYKSVMSFQYPERTFIESKTINILRQKELLDLCGIKETSHELHPRKLPFSKQKLLSVALALSESSDFAILDEPTAGMDYDDKILFIRLLNNFKNLAVIIFTHDRALEKIGRKLRWEDIAA